MTPDMPRKVLAVIPARMGSTRFPGKPLQKILNKPMIRWVYESAKKSKLIDEVIVATDSMEILNEVKSFGGKALMTDENHNTGLDRVIEVSEIHDKYDHYVNIQGDEPAMHPDTIDGIVKTLREKSQCEIATAAIAFTTYENFTSPHQVKVVFNADMKALYFSRSTIPWRADQNNLDRAYKHLGIYGYTKKAITTIKQLKPGTLESLEKLEQLRMLENNMNIFIYITSHDSIGVDTPQDIARAEEFLRKINKQ
jgi:3-deoxy-manno-octulosonate cytidylyltransferase (CMP-KDO synthetase)